MEKCLLDRPTLNEMFSGDNGCAIDAQILSETCITYITFAIASYLMGQKVLKPSLIGAFTILNGYMLAITDHLKSESETKSHERSHIVARAAMNLGMTLLVCRYVITTNWKWGATSVGLTTYFSEFSRTHQNRDQ